MAKAGPGRLRHRVGECIAREALWEPGHSVAVAVSGGLDSMVLLDVLHELTAWHGGRLTVITVDHGTRPSSSDDAAFVQEFCVARDLPCERARLELGESASELVCREARYDVFERLCVDRVALAHHRDDQAETVLLQLIRGAGTRGLGGMHLLEVCASFASGIALSPGRVGGVAYLTVAARSIEHGPSVSSKSGASSGAAHAGVDTSWFGCNPREGRRQSSRGFRLPVVSGRAGFRGARFCGWRAAQLTARITVGDSASFVGANRTGARCESRSSARTNGRDGAGQPDAKRFFSR